MVQLKDFVALEPFLAEAVPARLMIGRGEMLQANFPAAIEELRRVMAMTSATADSHVTATGFLADSLFHEEAFDQAISTYRAYLAARPQDAGAWINLGVALAQKRQPGSAGDAFKQALRLDPSNATARRNLAILRRGHAFSSMSGRSESPVSSLGSTQETEDGRGGSAGFLVAAFIVTVTALACSVPFTSLNSTCTVSPVWTRSVAATLPPLFAAIVPAPLPMTLVLGPIANVCVNVAPPPPDPLIVSELAETDATFPVELWPPPAPRQPSQRLESSSHASCRRPPCRRPRPLDRL